MKKHTISPSTSTRTAVLIDGSFFLKRYRNLFQNGRDHSPEVVANNLQTMVHLHVMDEYLYRVFFYDCKPFEQKIYNQYLNKTIDFKKTETAIWRNKFFEQ